MVHQVPPRRTERPRKVSVRAAAPILRPRSRGHLPDKGNPITAVLPRTALLRKVMARPKGKAVLRKVTARLKVTAVPRKVTADLRAAATARPARVGMARPLKVTARPPKVTADQRLMVRLRVDTTPAVTRRKRAW